MVIQLMQQYLTSIAWSGTTAWNSRHLLRRECHFRAQHGMTAWQALFVYFIFISLRTLYAATSYNLELLPCALSSLRLASTTCYRSATWYWFHSLMCRMTVWQWFVMDFTRTPPDYTRTDQDGFSRSHRSLELPRASLCLHSSLSQS